MAETFKPWKEMSAWEKTKAMAKEAVGGSNKAPAPKPAAKEEVVKKDIDAMKRSQAEKQMALKEYKKGGKVKKTGPAKLHKGEHVLTAKQTKKMEKKPAVKRALGVKKKK